jgi:replicative superfamily II helicase
MEQILRASDDDILVYVAPTKALVTQIAAEIYARFSKKMDASESFRLYRVDEHDGLTMFEQSRAGPYTRGIIVSTTLRNVRSW